MSRRCCSGSPTRAGDDRRGNGRGRARGADPALADLAGWLDEDREGRLVHRRLTEAAQEWEALGRDPGALLRGARLAAREDGRARTTPSSTTSSATTSPRAGRPRSARPSGSGARTAGCADCSPARCAAGGGGARRCARLPPATPRRGRRRRGERAAAGRTGARRETAGHCGTARARGDTFRCVAGDEGRPLRHAHEVRPRPPRRANRGACPAHGGAYCGRFSCGQRQPRKSHALRPAHARAPSTDHTAVQRGSRVRAGRPSGLRGGARG